MAMHRALYVLPLVLSSVPPVSGELLPAHPTGPERVAALFPGRLAEFRAGEEGATFDLLRRPSRRGKWGPLRVRLHVRDPDAALEGLELSVNGGPEILVDRHGLVRERPPEGFGDLEETPFLEVPCSPRGGPHRLLVRGRFVPGARKDRWGGTLRLLGAQRIDSVALFEGMRELSDLMARRYRHLRDLDLKVRREDFNLPPLDQTWPAIWHSKDSLARHLHPSVVAHFQALGQLTFRSYQRKGDPMHHLHETLQVFRNLVEHWRGAPAGGRAAWLYSGGPALYEYLDEVSQDFGRVREAYYPLAGLREPEERDPVAPARAALRRVRESLGNLTEVADRILSELEARAEAVTPETALSTVEFPRLERIYRNTTLARRPPVPEADGYRTHAEFSRPRPSELRGVGRAEGGTCSGCPPAPRRARDVRHDRYVPERTHIANYMDLVRNLVEHDLRQVRLWQSLIEGRSAGGRHLRAARLRPSPLVRLRVPGSRP